MKTWYVLGGSFVLNLRQMVHARVDPDDDDYSIITMADGEKFRSDTTVEDIAQALRTVIE